MSEEPILDSELRREADGPDDSADLVHRLRSRLRDRPGAVERLTAEIPSSPDYLRRRIVRALDGRIPLPEQTLDDFLVGEDPSYLYYLLDSLKQPLGAETFESLAGYPEREPGWLAAQAASVLASSYERDPGYVGSLLEAERPRGVLVAVLRTLFDRGAEGFSTELVGLLNQDPSPTVRFHAAVLLKAGDPEAFERVHAPESLRDHVSVDGYGAEATSR